MKKLHLFLFVCAFFAANLLNAQQRIFPVRKDTAPFDNRYYKQELGLDISGVFAGYVGGALVWKIRDDRSKLVPVGYSHFWRLQAGLYSDNFTGIIDSFTHQNYYYESRTPADGYINSWIMVGRERVNYANRFNFYYGWDFGPEYTYNLYNAHGTFLRILPDGSDYDWIGINRKVKTHSLGATMAGFIGVKYRITPRISLSVESAVTAFYQWSKRKLVIQSNDEDIATSEDTYHQFGGNIQY
ncbi:MAG: hypothetical protein IT269_13015, partial [Saprospiraceae bacterium]|nr:hypothetical protein [Saprospiraceae bacterium]